MPERSLPEPSDLLIWAASALLSLLAGLGAAFFLWSALHHSGRPAIAEAAVVSIGAGMALIGLSTDRPLGRLFFVVFAAVLVAGYILGGPEFARLVP